MPSRRSFVKGTLSAAAIAAAGGWRPAESRPINAIDRKALVRRHNVVRTASVKKSPLQVGNGNFAFGTDITGLQTFEPFNTMSQWGWYHAPMPEGKSLSDQEPVVWPMGERRVPYLEFDEKHPEVRHWNYANPSRINLARIGLTLRRADGSPASEADLQDATQELDRWTGKLTSTFTLDGKTVRVTTAAHPTRDGIACRVESAAVASGSVSAYLDFPAPDGREFCDDVGTWHNSERFKNEIIESDPRRIALTRPLDDDPYAVTITASATTRLKASDSPDTMTKIESARYGAGEQWSDVTEMVRKAVADGAAVVASNATFGDPAKDVQKKLQVTYVRGGKRFEDVVSENQTWAVSGFGGANCIRINAAEGARELSFQVMFAPGEAGEVEEEFEEVVSTGDVIEASSVAWRTFWQSGGAIDLSESSDPRWRELERRIVLSQYQAAVNCAGDLPPQESGLVNNGWHGKFHMEMYWWHAAHWALWGRLGILDCSSHVYHGWLAEARDRADRQGFDGARWTKMAGPDGRNAAHPCNAMLIWQQPHPMFLAELEYRARPTPATLDKWEEVIDATAEFMTSYAMFDEATGTYQLGPAMYIVSENTTPDVSVNPVFELSYWRTGLRLANAWRERQGKPRVANWDDVLEHLAPLPIDDGVYVTYEGIPEMWTKYNYEHPGLIGVLGMLPGDGVDAKIENATLDRVKAEWNFDRVWGWDWPMLAMCAARLGRPEDAIDFLMTDSPNFQFDDAGLATGGPWPYHPSNGGLLYAVAMMAAGWDGAPDDIDSPGFPGESWTVKHEGLLPAL